MFPRFIWMLVLVKRSSWKLVELSRGQMSLSPQNGEMVMVFLSSDRGRLSLIPPSTYRWRRKEGRSVLDFLLQLDSFIYLFIKGHAGYRQP